MANEKPRYWTSLEEYHGDPETLEKNQKEFPEDPFAAMQDNGSKATRRDFLKVMGFGLTAATLAACQKAPVKYIMPYVNRPADMLPGTPNYYASTFWDGQQFQPILVKTREGRPIFVEANPNSELTCGITPRAAAHVLGLYDEQRLQKPVAKGKGSDWNKIDKEITSALSNAKGIRLVTPTVISPSTKKLIGEFGEQYENFQHVQYDSISFSGILDANEEAFGKRALPRYRFDKADVIVGINCDFLCNWLSPAEHMSQWAKTRDVTGENHTMSRHYQLESVLSATGSKADVRIPIKPSHEAELVIKLYNYIVENRSGDGMEIAGNSLKGMADELKKNRGKSLVVSGSNDKEIQLLIAAINTKLQSYGNTIDMDTHANLRQGKESDMDQLRKDMESGAVDVVIFAETNPAYNYHASKKFEAALKKVKTRILVDTHETETGKHCNYLLAAHHSLEKWGDAEPYNGVFMIQQPTITPLFNTRSLEENLLRWMDRKVDFYAYIRDTWKETAYPNAEGAGSFKDFWREALRTAAFTSKNLSNGAGNGDYEYIADAGALKAKLRQRYKSKGKGFEVVTYQKNGIGDGSLAHLPWLQELPDTITRCTWDNYALVPLAYARDNNIATGDVINLSAGGFSGKVPVVVQPGLHPEVIGVALGYGRTVVGKAAKDVGFNAFPVHTVMKGYVQNFAPGKMSKVEGETYDLAFTQIQSTAVNDSRKEHIVKEETLVDFVKNPNRIIEERKEKSHHLLNMYPDYRLKPGEGHRWVMAIDLNTCAGCGACVVSCQSENNIPVVGKEEVLTGREMHWIRIDRYYSAAEEDRDSVKAAEFPEDFPDVVFEPMLCQHCDNAPCENVCPVLAIAHSSEGVNSMVYNRCVGTRYCANNCPYKVRRFNWFDYTNGDEWVYNPATEDSLTRMVLNPDVTVRGRGVMEKCSFCTQRLQEAKVNAQREERRVRDEDTHTACSKACPSGSIKFGDINDPDSEVHKLFKEEGHMFFVIEEVKTLPSIGYLANIRNRKKSDPKHVYSKA
ncbi:MAG: TAT-variant-translocated molybdopterin oxidoreductase [Bacteroidota bacterium]